MLSTGSPNILHLSQAGAITDATLNVTDSTLTLTTNGPTGTLTINNTSLMEPATNITSNFTGTALDGNVTETGNTCASVAPQASCTLTYTPGSNVVPPTSFTIQGSNTNGTLAAIQIDAGLTLSSVSPASGSASGGTGVTLTGVGLTGTTDVTFGGVAATSVNVINSTTVSAVTPAHVIGAVDVVITTPSGSTTDVSGYTYLTTVVGQSAFGGTIACLNPSNNLIAATADNSSGIQWYNGAFTTTGATSPTDGFANTTAIVTSQGATITDYSAGLCQSYQVDSQGHTPCKSGNTCYSDWFLPAGHNAASSGQLNCLYTNQADIGGFASAFYWSSTENNQIEAWNQNFSGGSQGTNDKDNAYQVRCVRNFIP